MELILDRDMGKLGKRATWSLTAGFSIADIHSSIYAVGGRRASSTLTDDLRPLRAGRRRPLPSQLA
jgi:hypothetical protein